MSASRGRLRFSAGIVLMMIVGSILAMIFLTVRAANSIPLGMNDVLAMSTDTDENDPQYALSVEQPAVQCFTFTQVHKKVCAQPGSELENTASEKGALDDNFSEMVILSASDGRIPQTSWLEVAEFPVIPLVYVHLSDGHIIYGAGKGSTFKEAMSHLALGFFATGVRDMHDDGEPPAARITI